MQKIKYYIKAVRWLWANREWATTNADIDDEVGFCPTPETISGLVCDCTRRLAKAHISTTSMDGSEDGVTLNLVMCIDMIRDWFATNNLDLAAILREKHECNKTRPYRHGGKKL